MNTIQWDGTTQGANLIIAWVRRLGGHAELRTRPHHLNVDGQACLPGDSVSYDGDHFHITAKITR